MKPLKLYTKDILSIANLSKDEIIDLFDFTLKLKSALKKGKNYNFLAKKSLAMIFEKRSTRTRVSFETGITQLGGHALFLSSDDIQLGRGETLSDTAQVLSRYVDGIMIRTDSHDKVVELATNSTIPVINGLTDKFHPCQALTDYFTIYERERDLSSVKLTYIGDGNNMANSLLLGAAILGIDISIACPKKYSPDIQIVEEAYKLALFTDSNITVSQDIDECCENANYIYTDVWVSMGQEKGSAKKKKDLAKYKITSKILDKCAKDCKILHCLPAHRGEEIDADVIDSKQSIVFDQAENRLHVQKAIMCSLMR
ncbi:ornithine carbamoyltransferase [Spirochaetota bacterium]